MTLTLHRIRAAPLLDGSGEHLFIFSVENAHKLSGEPRGVESEEFNCGGTEWSLVCARREDSHLGVFLKWKYPDPCSAASVWARSSFAVTVVHQHRSAESVTFSSRRQVFSGSQTLLGKSKVLPLREFLDPARGFLDGTGKQAMLELRMSECSFRFEAVVDVSSRNRTRKNQGGIYFDSSAFVLANHRWYLRLYTKKVNSGGFPAVYLYLHGGSQGISIELSFTLSLAESSTEGLRYEFGEGAKYDGFGKTLPDVLGNPDKLTELSAAVEITRVVAYKLVFLKLPAVQSPSAHYAQRNHRKSPLFFNRPPSRALSRDRLPTPTFNLADANQQVFQDHYGNPWKVEFPKEPPPLESDDNSTCVMFEKGVYHYPNNKSKLVCVQLSLMSQNLELAQDVYMSNRLLVCYFSNSLDDKGYPVTFPVSPQQLSAEKFGYLNENGEVLIRIDLVSVQTSSFPVRSGPKFDHLINHQLEKSTNSSILDTSLKDVYASRASLSILDERPPSDSSSGFVLSTPKSGSDDFNRVKSMESLLSSGQSDGGTGSLVRGPAVNTFLVELVQSLSLSSPNAAKDDDLPWTTRTKTRGSDSGKGRRLPAVISSFDETAMLRHARCSSKDELRQKEMTDVLVKFLEQRFPLRMTEVVTLGSQGTSTTTASRCDVDIVVISPDLPRLNHSAWMVPFVHALRRTLEQCSIFDASVSALNCTSFATSRFSIQFTCDELMEVDIWVCPDWSVDDHVPERSPGDQGRNHHGDWCQRFLEIAGETPKDSRFFEMCSARMKDKFFGELSEETRNYIKVVKHWRNSVFWTKFDYRPDSYLISLLVVKATQDVNESSLKSVLQRVARYLKEPELRITWDGSQGRETSGKFRFEPPTPLVEDPTNPAVNVAQRLKYWGQFRTKYLNWLDSLNVSH